MELLPKGVAALLPPLYSQENNPDPCVPVKFFDPTGSWSWYAIEAKDEGNDVLFFGFVHGFEDELGYFSLNELRSVKGALGLGIERDLHWNPKTKLSEVKSGAKR